MLTSPSRRFPLRPTSSTKRHRTQKEIRSRRSSKRPLQELLLPLHAIFVQNHSIFPPCRFSYSQRNPSNRFICNTKLLSISDHMSLPYANGILHPSHPHIHPRARRQTSFHHIKNTTSHHRHQAPFFLSAQFIQIFNPILLIQFIFFQQFIHISCISGIAARRHYAFHDSLHFYFSSHSASRAKTVISVIHDRYITFTSSTAVPLGPPPVTSILYILSPRLLHTHRSLHPAS